MNGRRPPDPNHFLALRLDDDTRERLLGVAERMRAWDLPARWTHPDDLHLTVLFLGPVDEAEARLLPTILEDIAGTFPRPVLRLTGAGADGGSSEPRHVFAAVQDADGSCAGMHRDLSEMLEMKPGPAFRPHVTLCRPQPKRENPALHRDWPQLLEAIGLAEWGPCGTTDMVLWRSSGTGATRYQELARWPLG